ncbi:MAG: tripartite tricarboxylate transporter substrate binding protein [Hyphomicrobiales bacterium]|nr:tripartite tricarboxylate transporter substrate binding protein [Hyphomicrobiales bacterium]
MSIVRMLACALIPALLLLARSSPLAAQDYPNRPITFVVGYTAGATSDLVARTVGERLSAAWGQTVIVDNRSGVGGNLAAAQVARAAPDGYTLLIGTDALMTTNSHLYKSVPFDPVKDFAPVIYGGANIICLAVYDDFPAKSVAELIAWAKANPGKLNYAHTGVGSPHHLAGELLRQQAGIAIVHVPYRGGGAAINDLVGGHVKVAFLSLSVAVPHIASGKIRILAVVEKDRYPPLREVPTVAETLPGFEMTSWHAFFAPVATPAPLVARLNAAIGKVLNTDAVKEKLAGFGVAVSTGSPEELAQIVKNGLEVRGRLVKAANIQPE